MNYRDEAHHDRFFISLAENLHRLGRLDILSEAFELPVLGPLIRAQRRKPFDIEITFSNLSCVIETKVDSDEDGRWNADWQTDRIFRNVQLLDYLRQEKQFLFVTYGTSEYYTKPYANGPASSHFKHVKLEDMAAFVESSLQLTLANQDQYDHWLAAMRIEQSKRSQAIEMLKDFALFRDHYLRVHEDVDFPNNRLVFCAPELAFPVFHALALEWNSNPSFSGRFGRVAVYPVTRMTPPVQDSILNFWEMWDSGKPKIGSDLVGHGPGFYFEINEDFNLNLKLSNAELSSSLRDEVWRRLNYVNWPPDVKGRSREYKQDTWVLYEWDFGFLKFLGDYRPITQRLFTVLESAIQSLG